LFSLFNYVLVLITIWNVHIVDAYWLVTGWDCLA